MPRIEFKKREIVAEGYYVSKFLGADLFPKTQEEATAKGWEAPMLSWQFQITQQCKFVNWKVGGLTSQTWSPKNKTGKFLTVLGCNVQMGSDDDPNRFIGKDVMIHVINKINKRGLETAIVDEIFPVAGVSAPTQAAPSQQATQQVVQQPNVTTTVPVQAQTTTVTEQPTVVETKETVTPPKESAVEKLKKFKW